MGKKMRRTVKLSEQTLRRIVSRVVKAQTTEKMTEGIFKRKTKLKWDGSKKGTDRVELHLCAQKGSGDQITCVEQWSETIPPTPGGGPPGERVEGETWDRLKDEGLKWAAEWKKEYKFTNRMPEFKDISTDTGHRPFRGETFKPHPKKQPPKIQERVDKQLRDAYIVLKEQIKKDGWKFKI